MAVVNVEPSLVLVTVQALGPTPELDPIKPLPQNLCTEAPLLQAVLGDGALNCGRPAM